ncbi:MAG: response regulator [Dehalococcoidia bacterium]
MNQGAVPVVIVDDEVDHAIIIRRVLAAIAPYAAVDVMTDPHAVEDRLIQAPPRALLLMDRMLAGRQSIDLIPGLLRARPDLSIALLSAALSDEDRKRALAAGAVAAAEKPGTLDGWRMLLRELLGLHRARSVA